MNLSLPICLLLLTGLSVPGCRQSDAATEPALPNGEVWLSQKQVDEGGLRVTPAARRSLGTTMSTTGRVTFDDAHVAHVFSPVTGRIATIEARPGQRVHKGAVLATIDSPDVGVASSELDKSSADLSAADHEFKRQKELYEAHAGAQRDYETAEDNYLKAKAESQRAHQKARLLRGGSIDLVTQNYLLRALIDGEVVGRNVNPGMEVQGQYSGGAAVELFTIGELDPIWIVADIFEMDVGRVKIGQQVTAKVISYPDRTFEGTVDWISGTLDPNSRTVRARCTIPNADHLLKPEMYASVAIHVEQHDGLAVPKRAVLRLADQTVVFVEVARNPDGLQKFERRPVTVDEEGGDEFVPVLHGVEAGEKVVVDGALLLSAMF